MVSQPLSDSSNFDNDFCHRVTTRAHDVLKTCTEDPSEALCEPLEYEEVAHVCSRLKPGAASISIDYEHIGYAGPPLWKVLFCLYRGLLRAWFCVLNSKNRNQTPYFQRERSQSE